MFCQKYSTVPECPCSFQVLSVFSIWLFSWKFFMKTFHDDPLTLTTQPHQKIRFLGISFWILYMFAIVSNLRKKKFLFLSKPPKITFRTTNLQTPIKPVGNIFDRRDPKKPTLNCSFPTEWYPCLDISLFCYSCVVHNNLWQRERPPSASTTWPSCTSTARRRP